VRGKKRGAKMHSLGEFDPAPRIIFVEEIRIMTAKFFRLTTALLGFAIAISVAAGVSAAQYGTAAPPPRPTPMENPQTDKNAGKEPDKKIKINKAEEAAYKAFTATQGGDPAMQIQLGEDFAAKFPMSRYLPGVYGVLTAAYFSTGATDKMFTAGAKTLELDPDNVDVLALLAMAIPRRVKQTSPDYADQMKKADSYAHHAIELIPTLAKPETVDDATFEKAKNDKLSLAHSGLGLMALNNKKYPDAKNELEQAVKLASSPDPVDYYLLGNADIQGSYYHAAITAYEQCAASGPLVAQCKAREDSAKKDLASGTKLSID
jgi:tetratricopeptide (TPR) repeat protein